MSGSNGYLSTTPSTDGDRHPHDEYGLQRERFALLSLSHDQRRRGDEQLASRSQWRLPPSSCGSIRPPLGARREVDPTTIFAAGETLTPPYPSSRVAVCELTSTDRRPTVTRLKLIEPNGVRRTITHRGRARTNTVRLPRRSRGKLLTGTYRVILTPAKTLYDTGPGRPRRLVFAVRRSRRISAR